MCKMKFVKIYYDTQYLPLTVITEKIILCDIWRKTATYHDRKISIFIILNINRHNIIIQPKSDIFQFFIGQYSKPLQTYLFENVHIFQAFHASTIVGNVRQSKIRRLRYLNEQLIFIC